MDISLSGSVGICNSLSSIAGYSGGRPQLTKTPDGFEELQLSFTLPSHKPPPKQALAARVVNVASESHRLGKIDFDNMNDEWREKGI
ncbi:hypothetical protein BC936DRAFT_147509 [Jimgerdemannia flammicorona]|uniref:Uncharacterized protein n=1 Tax=Jimgerdemannia flammicorona TaxID=994334 RepID=A0A433D549_9FUNG|nr:hypothetical protein BC936DRAFT_147509 [Jimgerdemannia flammicorona]